MPINPNVSSDTEFSKETRRTYIKQFAKLFAAFTFVTSSQYFVSIICTYIVAPEAASAVSTGTLTFGLLYGLLGFIRMLTTASSANSHGLKNRERYWGSFIEMAIPAITIGILIIIFKHQLFNAAMMIYVKNSNIIKEYYDVTAWVSPTHLLNFVIIGWLMGQRRARTVVVLHALSMILNIALGAIFASMFDIGVRAIAYATIISQVVVCILGLSIIMHIIPKEYITLNPKRLNLHVKEIAWANFFLFLRTVFLIVQANIHNSIANTLDHSFLAANNVLIQILVISSSIFEGIGAASCAFVGQAIGSKNQDLLKFTWKMTNYFTLLTGVLISIVFFIFRDELIVHLARSTDVINTAIHYSLWLLPYFIIGGFGMSYYGMFVGAIYTKPVVVSVYIAIMLFVFMYYFTRDVVLKLGYSPFVALWFAYVLFYITRTFGLFSYKDKLLKLAQK